MLGVAISCYIGHLPQLLDLFDSIQSQTLLPSKVVVSCSSTPEGVIRKLTDRSLKKYTFPYQILYTPEHKNAAQNRNIAIDNLLDMDYISFIDADDIMHPQRLESVMNVFKESDSDIILHNFLFNLPFQKIDMLVYRLNSMRIHESGCIEHLERKYMGKDLIHHSQSSVKRYIVDKVRFREDPSYARREDCFFCADIFRLFPKHAYIQDPLSYYKASLTEF